MVVPGVVLAVGIYAVYLDTQLVGTLTGFVLAHTMLAVPFVIIAVSASLEVFDKRLETAAVSLGATQLTAFRTVTLPLIAPGILSGLLFAFVTSFDEIIVALFITSPYLKTLPVQIFSSITRDADPTVAAVGTLLFIATSLVIGAGCYRFAPGKSLRWLHPSSRGATIDIRSVSKRLRRLHRARRGLAAHRAGRVHDAARAQWFGQDDDAERHRRLHRGEFRRRLRSAARASSACRRTSATSAWCSSTTRCFRT